MQNDYFGGLHGDTMVSVLREGKSTPVKLSELAPGDYIKVPGRWNWEVEEVRCFKRNIEAFRLNLESGGNLVVAKGTVLAGLAGCAAPHTGQTETALFFARQNASRKESRRAFVVSLLGNRSAPTWLRKAFKSRKLFGGAKGEKQFYFPAQAIRFLNRTALDAVQRGDHIPIFSGVFAARNLEREGQPSIQLNIPAADAYSAPAILPLFAVDEDTQPKVIASAAKDYAGRLQFEVVKSIEPISFRGPWYYPIFEQRPVRGRDIDPESMDDLKSVHPWSFDANGIAIFYPDEYVSNDCFFSTARNPDRLLIRPRSKRYVPSLSSLFEATPPGESAAPISIHSAAQQVARIFARVKQARLSERKLCIELEKLTRK